MKIHHLLLFLSLLLPALSQADDELQSGTTTWSADHRLQATLLLREPRDHSNSADLILADASGHELHRQDIFALHKVNQITWAPDSRTLLLISNVHRESSLQVLRRIAGKWQSASFAPESASYSVVRIERVRWLHGKLRLTFLIGSGMERADDRPSAETCHCTVDPATLHATPYQFDALAIADFHTRMQSRHPVISFR